MAGKKLEYLLRVFALWTGFMIANDIWDARSRSREERDRVFIRGAEYTVGGKIIHNESKDSGVWISGKDWRQMDLGERERAFFIRRYGPLAIGLAMVYLYFRSAEKIRKRALE